MKSVLKWETVHGLGIALVVTDLRAGAADLERPAPLPVLLSFSLTVHQHHPDCGTLHGSPHLVIEDTWGMQGPPAHTWRSALDAYTSEPYQKEARRVGTG